MSSADGKPPCLKRLQVELPAGTCPSQFCRKAKVPIRAGARVVEAGRCIYHYSCWLQMVGCLFLARKLNWSLPRNGLNRNYLRTKPGLDSSSQHGILKRLL